MCVAREPCEVHWVVKCRIDGANRLFPRVFVVAAHTLVNLLHLVNDPFVSLAGKVILVSSHCTVSATDGVF